MACFRWASYRSPITLHAALPCHRVLWFLRKIKQWRHACAEDYGFDYAESIQLSLKHALTRTGRMAIVRILHHEAYFPRSNYSFYRSIFHIARPQTKNGRSIYSHLGYARDSSTYRHNARSTVTATSRRVDESISQITRDRSQIMLRW